MTMKARNPIGMPAVEADERHQSEVDAFIARNRDELNASVHRSRQEVAMGVQSTRTVGDIIIISDGRKRHGAT